MLPLPMPIDAESTPFSMPNHFVMTVNASVRASQWLRPFYHLQCQHDKDKRRGEDPDYDVSMRSKSRLQ